ncbi:MAG: hypothetical protein KAX80_03960 [Planctomycetes bacterium]|nr:hypothetical protein [Planctomycetota bacterium]
MDSLGRYGFWVGVGVVLVAALVLGLVGVQGVAGQNRRMRDEFKDMDQQVRLVAESGDLPSERSVEDAEQYRTSLRTQYEKNLELIQSRAVDLYRRLPGIVDADCVSRETPEGETYLLPRGAAFKTRYPEAAEELGKMVQDAGIVLRSPGIGLPQLTGAMPSDELILRLQRRYWLLSEVVDALVENRVVDEVLLLTEEVGLEEGRRGPSMAMMRGGMEESAVLSRSVGQEFRAFETTRGRESEAHGTFARLVTGNVGISTEMNKLFSPWGTSSAQRQVRLVVVMDFREIPVIVQALMNMDRLTLVRTVSWQKSAESFEEAPSKPEVRVDIRALCFDRYQEFVPTEEAGLPLPR